MPKRLLHILLVCLAAVTMLGAGNPATRFDHLGHKLMCTCSCGEILLECNHVGCPVSGPMIQELNNQLATALPDIGVLNWFVQKYGPIVLAAPIRGGFDLVAWIVPFAVLTFGILGVVWLVRLWHQRQPQTALAQPSSASATLAAGSLRDRIRRETTYEP